MPVDQFLDLATGQVNARSLDLTKMEA
jgi:hypothetical protein